MTKAEFLSALRKRLSGLPKEDVERSVEYYREMLDDRMEEGLPEETAVRELGSVEEVAESILADMPLGKLVKTRVAPERARSAGEIVLIVLGSPIWASLLLAAAAVFLSLYLVVWTTVFVAYVVFGSVAASSLAGLLGTVFALAHGNSMTAVFLLGAALLCAGLSILLFHGSNSFGKAVFALSRKGFVCLKRCIAKKEVAE